MRSTLLGSVLCLVMFAAVPLTAGGSIYSRYGIGDILSFHGTRPYAFGGASIAIASDGFINILNPAGMAKIRFTRFAGAFEFTKLSSKSDDASATYSYGNFQGAAFAIPIDTSAGVVVSLESTPYSSVRYAVAQSDTTSLAASDQTYYGTGGLSTLAIGSSVSVTEDLHLGAKLIYYYGRMRQYATVNFSDGQFLDGSFDRTRFASGLGASFGAIADRVGAILGLPALDNLSLGIVLSTPVGLESHEEEYLSSLDTTNRRAGTVDLPLVLGIGVSYLTGERYLFAGDLLMQDWNSATVYGVHPSEFRTSYRAGVGLEVLPVRGTTSYFQRTAYRIGAYYHASYLQLRGNGIDELGVTGGVGLPFGPDSRLNLGIQLGFRGTTSASLQKDTILRLSVGISASEVWFMHFDEE